MCPVTRQCYKAALKRILDGLGVPSLLAQSARVGAFRHFYKSLLDDLGMYPDSIRDAMGHADNAGAHHYGQDVPMPLARLAVLR
jgi:hypothetical protein